ncbi:hypothetical protein V1478_009400, partial [Vespula squamosa]
MFPVFLSDMSDNDVEGSLVTIITTPHHYGALKPDGLVTGDSKYSKEGWLKPPVDRKRYNDERTVRNDRGRCRRVNYNDFTYFNRILCSLIDDYVTNIEPLYVYTKDCLIGALSSQRILLFGGGIN